MTRWEHLRVVINPRTDLVMATLDLHGAEGWELVAAFGPSNQFEHCETYVFKRPAQGASE